MSVKPFFRAGIFFMILSSVVYYFCLAEHLNVWYLIKLDLLLTSVMTFGFCMGFVTRHRSGYKEK